MGNRQDVILINAKICLMTTEEGGRINGIKSGYRPNHVFIKTEDNTFSQTYIGEIQFDEQEFIELGESKNVTVSFLRLGEIEKYLSIGRKWFIFEGGKFVGEAEIIGM